MKTTTTTTTGAGNLSAVRILDAKDAIFASHDYNQGPQTCFVQNIGEAKLFAAASELFGALESLVDSLGAMEHIDGFSVIRDYHAARAVLAKIANS